MPISDPYLSDDFVFDRLLSEYQKYKKLIIAVDFDDTIYDFHKKGYQYSQVIELVKKYYHNLNFHIVIFTGSEKEKYPFIKEYCANNLLIPDIKVNENAFPMPVGNNGKIYYNALLDDRAGLSSSFFVLSKLYETIQQVNK